MQETNNFYLRDNITELYKLFDNSKIEKDLKLNELNNGIRTKMSGLDRNNMNLIESTLKKLIRSLNQDGELSIEEKVKPATFA